MKKNKFAASVQPKSDTVRKRGKYTRTLDDLANAVRAAMVRAELQAYDLGKSDRQTGVRDHPPYGFSNLKKAWWSGYRLGASPANKMTTGR